MRWDFEGTNTTRAMASLDAARDAAMVQATTPELRAAVSKRYDLLKTLIESGLPVTLVAPVAKILELKYEMVRR